MPILGDVVSGGNKRARVTANNKVKIADGTRPAEIADVWIYNVDADGKYTREKTGEQKVSIKILFEKRPDIVLDKRMRAYLGAKSHFAKLIGSLTGLEPGSEAMRQYDTDKLIGMKVLVKTVYAEPYTNIESILPAVSASDDDFGDIPPQTLAAVDAANQRSKSTVEPPVEEYDTWPEERR